MKRRREEKILLDALHGAGCDVTDTIKCSVSAGLKQIRREKFEERKLQKEERRQAKHIDR